MLGAAEIAAVVAAHVNDYRERIYSPLDTLRLFIGQVLSPDRACQDVVGRRLSERTAQGKSTCTLNTGSYCDARARLPIGIPVALGNKIGTRLESMTPKAWHWQARHVKLDVATSRNMFDGTTVASVQPPHPNSRVPLPVLRLNRFAIRCASQKIPRVHGLGGKLQVGRWTLTNKPGKPAVSASAA